MTIQRFFSPIILFLFLASPLAHADLRIGTPYFAPPFVFSATTGFSIDLIKLVCQGMNEKCTIQQMRFNDLFGALATGKIDLAIGGIAIASKDQTPNLFSQPYMQSRAQFLIRIAQSNDYQSTADLKGTTVGIIRGIGRPGHKESYYNDYLVANYNNEFKVKEYDDMEDLISALSNGDIAAAFFNEGIAHYWVLNGSNQFKTLGQPTAIGSGIGIMAAPSSQALMARVNAQVQRLEQDGSIKALYNVYFPWTPENNQSTN